MLSKSFLKNQTMHSPLANQTMIKAKNGRGKRSLAMSLMLTSLIDAFSILVIFLLSSGNNTGKELDLHKVQLPIASHSDSVGMGTIVKITEGRYTINDHPVSQQGLAAALITIKKKEDLIIQADRKIEFNLLNPVILAAQHAGFEKFKFVVLQKDTTKERLAFK